MKEQKSFSEVVKKLVCDVGKMVGIRGGNNNEWPKGVNKGDSGRLGPAMEENGGDINI